MALRPSVSGVIEALPAAVTAYHQALAIDDPRLVLTHDPDSVHAACFRVLRQRLIAQKGLRTLVVSSAAPREGKTTCAINLSLALSETAGARVLLVEANVRAPAVADRLGISPPLCFAAQLAKARAKPSPEWTVVSVNDGSLHVLAVSPASTDERLDAPGFERAMKTLREAPYHFIVIDAPSVLGSADVNLIQDSADGVLLTTWGKRSRGAAQLRAVDQLGPGKVVGFVLLDARG